MFLRVPSVLLAPGAALKYRENAKISAYEPLAKESGCRFVPFAFESCQLLERMTVTHDDT